MRHSPEWLAGCYNHVVVVAHSQGGVMAHLTLRIARPAAHSASTVRAFGSTVARDSAIEDPPLAAGAHDSIRRGLFRNRFTPAA